MTASRRRARARLAADHGAVAGLEALAFGTLVFVAGTMLLVNAWGVIDAKFAVAAAAREATRTFVETPGSAADQAHARALGAAHEALAGHGKTGTPQVEITVDGAPAGLVRCAAVTTTVRYHVPSLFVPFVGRFGDLGFTVEERYSEVVDPYRSGLPGGDGCGGG